MRHIAVLIFGGLLALFHLPWLVLAILGLIAGLVIGIADDRWPEPRPSRVHRMDRPQFLTASQQLLSAILLIVLGIAAVTLLWWYPDPNARSGPLFFTYLASFGVGSAIWILIAGKRIRERRNDWLASLDAGENLELRQ